MKKKKIGIDLLMLGLFIVGIGALLYPFVSNSLSNYFDQQIISYYQEKENDKNKEEVDQIHAEMEAKNKEIAKQSSPGVDPYSLLEETPISVEAPLSFYEQHTIGVITIPKINVRLPIYDKTLPILLEKGASLLDGTSYPTGGESTHSVLTSHAGLTQAKLFTDLDQLEKGDEFYVEINGRTLAYKVNQKKVVLPEETDDVKVVDGEDLLTLITCTPYMINTHRLLVRGHRIPYLPTTAGPLEKVAEIQTQHMFLLGSLVVGFSLFVLYLLTRLIMDYMISRREYDVTLTIQDDAGHFISNLEFELYNAKGNKPILDASGMPIKLISNPFGEIKTSNLRGGKYTLRNKAEGLTLRLKVKWVKSPLFNASLKDKHPRWELVKAGEGLLLLGKSS